MATLNVKVELAERVTRENNLAKALAEWALCGYVDSHGKPIAEHCIRVGERLWVDEAPCEVVLAGYLHDVVEDSDLLSLATIADLFGYRISNLVDILTRRPPKQTYENYIEMVCLDREAVLIKLYDMADNMDESRGPIPGHLAERYAKYWPKLLAVTGPVERFTKEAKWKPS